MSQQWYVNIDQKECGPMTAAELKQLVKASNVKPDTRVRLGEEGKWVLASKVKGLGFSLEERKAKQLEEIKALENTPRNRRLATPLSLCLTIVFMVAALVLMTMIQMQRAKTRAEIQSKENEPVMKTTFNIEMMAMHVKSTARRNGGALTKDLSGAFSDDADGWGRSMRIEPEGSPVSTYKIASAGADGQFNTADDVALRFNMNHEQIERINTYGMQEIKAEMNAVTTPVRDADLGEEEPGGRFTYSNGVAQVLMARDAEYFKSICESEKDLERVVEALDNNHERLMDHVEEVDPRAKTPVPGGRFSDEQWAEVEEVAKGIGLAEMRPIYDLVLKEAGID